MEVLTLKELAERLKISKAKATQLWKSRQIPAMRLDGHPRFNWETVMTKLNGGQR